MTWTHALCVYMNVVLPAILLCFAMHAGTGTVSSFSHSELQSKQESWNLKKREESAMDVEAPPVEAVTYICSGELLLSLKQYSAISLAAAIKLEKEFQISFKCLWEFFSFAVSPSLECGHDVTLQPSSAVRCRNCGSRILYKKRTRKRKQNVCVCVVNNVLSVLQRMW